MKKYIKIFLFCLLPVFCGNIYAQNTSENQSAMLSTDVDIPAQFPGGEKALMKFFDKNLKIPSDAESVIPHKVFCEFTIDTLGNITNVQITKSSNVEAVDNEVMRVVKLMPQWTPAQHNGKNVNCELVVPIVLVVKKDLKIMMVKE